MIATLLIGAAAVPILLALWVAAWTVGDLFDRPRVRVRVRSRDTRR